MIQRHDVSYAQLEAELQVYLLAPYAVDRFMGACLMDDTRGRDDNASIADIARAVVACFLMTKLPNLPESSLHQAVHAVDANEAADRIAGHYKDMVEAIEGHTLLVFEDRWFQTPGGVILDLQTLEVIPALKYSPRYWTAFDVVALTMETINKYLEVTDDAPQDAVG